MTDSEDRLVWYRWLLPGLKAWDQGWKLCMAKAGQHNVVLNGGRSGPKKRIDF